MSRISSKLAVHLCSQRGELGTSRGLLNLVPDELSLEDACLPPFLAQRAQMTSLRLNTYLLQD